MISVVIPVHNAENSLRRCLEAVVSFSSAVPCECIVVNDCSTDASGAVAREFPVRVLNLEGGPYGPAYARNRGSEIARGDILFFVDADVVLHPTTLKRVWAVFIEHPEVDAAFGSYDDRPGTPDFLSRYRNLLHHFIHQQAQAEAGTFWSACGAVRRLVFLELGGFDEARYPRPSVEDIDLGYRLKARGHRIRLDKHMQVKHLKRWTLRGMIQTDVVDRAIPWTRLLLEARGIPNDLNLRLSHRLSTIMLACAMLYLVTVASAYSLVMIPALAGLFLLATGSWSDEGLRFQMSARMKKVTYAFATAAAAGGLYAGSAETIAPTGIVLAGILMDPLLPQSARLWAKVLFGALLMTLAAGMIMVLKTFPLELVAPLLLVTAAIMLINYRLYAFFMRSQGALFMLAAIPFHALYYLYSGAAFMLGAGIHFWQRVRTRWAAPA